MHAWAFDTSMGTLPCMSLGLPVSMGRGAAWRWHNVTGPCLFVAAVESAWQLHLRGKYVPCQLRAANHSVQVGYWALVRHTGDKFGEQLA